MKTRKMLFTFQSWSNITYHVQKEVELPKDWDNWRRMDQEQFIDELTEQLILTDIEVCTKIVED